MTSGQDQLPVTIRPATDNDVGTCEGILRALPDWFGIDEAIGAYAADIASMRTFVACVDELVVGFVTVNAHNPSTLEIHVMAVDAGYHRSGIGRALVERAERTARLDGHSLLEVKTLGPSHPSPEYAATRHFYEAVGFLPLEEIEDIWPGNPCLIMVKVLSF